MTANGNAIDVIKSKIKIINPENERIILNFRYFLDCKKIYHNCFKIQNLMNSPCLTCIAKETQKLRFG